MAWDCGAGSGQATVALAARFEQVLGTDISAAQLASAPALANVQYRVTPAEASGLPDRSTDLITVAQALHWFDLPKFYAEVERVLKPQGVIAAWGYNRLLIDQPEAQRAVDRFYEETIGSYWPPERVHVENGYRDLPFPFARIAAPGFSLRKDWTREHLLGYLRSWSAVGRFKAANGYDPVDALAGEIATHWPEGKMMRVEWPLFMLAGRTDHDL
jgi:SAM-dependent methyltransferase